GRSKSRRTSFRPAKVQRMSEMACSGYPNSCHSPGRKYRSQYQRLAARIGPSQKAPGRSACPLLLIICDESALARLVYDLVTPELIAVEHHALHGRPDVNCRDAVLGGHGIVEPVVFDVSLMIGLKGVVVDKSPAREDFHHREFDVPGNQAENGE